MSCCRYIQQLCPQTTCHFLLGSICREEGAATQLSQEHANIEVCRRGGPQLQLLWVWSN